MTAAADVKARGATPTLTACVRRFCLECLGAKTGRGAFDCESRVCPLHPAAPFRRGRHQRVTKAMVGAYCRHCQPEEHSDCGGPHVYPDGSIAQPECALYPWRPWQPGGVPKTRTATAKQRGHLARMRQSRQKQRQPCGKGVFGADSESRHKFRGMGTGRASR